MLQGLRTVGYFVDDLEAAKAWYRELLGFGPYFDMPFYVGFEVGGYELGLRPGGSGRPGIGGDTAYWGVQSMEAALARVTGMGAEIVAPARDVGDGIVVATVRDPFGNALGLIVNPHFRAEVGAKVAAAGSGLSPREIVHEVSVAAPPEEVWRLWTTTAGITEWLVREARVDLRIGGAYELYFLVDNPPDLRGSERCRVLAFLPDRLLTFTWNAPPHLRTRAEQTWCVLTLEPVAGGTRVKLVHAGWPEAGLADGTSDWPETYATFERSWGGVMRALAARCGEL